MSVYEKLKRTILLPLWFKGFAVRGERHSKDDKSASKIFIQTLQKKADTGPTCLLDVAKKMSKCTANHTHAGIRFQKESCSYLAITVTTKACVEEAKKRPKHSQRWRGRPILT